jgi:hypothetical protein
MALSVRRDGGRPGWHAGLLTVYPSIGITTKPSADFPQIIGTHFLLKEDAIQAF